MRGTQGTQIAGASRLLNGVSVLEISLGNIGRAVVQAALVTNKAYYLWYRVEYATGLADTTIPTADGLLTHGGSIPIDTLDPSKTAYLYLLLTDDTGTAQNGGALDYVLITRDLR